MSAVDLLPHPNETLSTYAYSYPHKSSYRALETSVALADAWEGEDTRALSLYVHIPFCEMRCGFCNLFAESQPEDSIVDRYLATLERQMRIVRSAVPEATIGQFALGGGTPTYLSACQLASLLERIETHFGLHATNVPTSVETSPATATRDHLKVLADHGVQRVSLGVQSFSRAEAKAIGRPQIPGQAERALEIIRSAGIDVLNIDLMYGQSGQTVEQWLATVTEALRYEPEELYLYPLYVRPETGIAQRQHGPARHRSDLYRAARTLLLEQGYEQASLRCFRKSSLKTPSTTACQRDGMIGLGCGARSYTSKLHYATRFAVTQAGVRAILAEWISQSDAELNRATHGIYLSEDEQRRRFLILSVLQAEGMELDSYRERFRSHPGADMPAIAELKRCGWLVETQTRLLLTEDGMEHSDEVGPLLYSTFVRDRLREFVRL